MTTTSHQITFNRECELSGTPLTKDGFEFKSTLEIDPLSPAQNVTPCPDTMLRYTSNIEGGIDVFAKHGQTSVVNVTTDTFNDKITLDVNGEATIPHHYQQIRVVKWQPLKFNGDECGGYTAGIDAISIIEGVVKGTGPGILTYQIQAKVFSIAVTLELPPKYDISLGKPNELIIVCQGSHKTALKFEYGYCSSGSLVAECCEQSYKLPLECNAPDSMGSNSSVTVFVKAGCAPYSWTVFGAVFSDGEESEEESLRTIKTKDACNDVTVVVTDACGYSDSATISINECCPGFILSLLEGDISKLNGMGAGETASFVLGTSGDGTRTVWVEGSDKVTVRSVPTDGDNSSILVTSKSDACEGPFKFGIIDECNPDYIFYFSGSVASGNVC